MSRDYYSASPPDPEEPRMKQCPECGGRGYFIVHEAWTYQGPGPLRHKEDCPTCHGTGEVEDDREHEPDFDTLEEARGER